MHKEYCDNCDDELERLSENTGTQSVKITIKIESERRDISAKTQKEFCSVSCAITWLTKHKAFYHHQFDKK